MKKVKNWLKYNWFKVLAIGLLLGALADNPYGYYQFLRWAILVIGAVSAYLSYQGDKKVWTGLFVVIVILFNPIIPFHLSREIWQPIDVIAAIIFFVSFFLRYEPKD